MAAMWRAHDGENPDLLYLEHIANADTETVEGGDDL